VNAPVSVNAPASAPAAVSGTSASDTGVFNFTAAFGEAMVELGAAMPRLTAITAAMEQGTGLAPFRAAFPDRFFDAGIAEAHAVTFAAALAARGLRPVAALYSTFLQRAADQVIHDAALQRLPVVFAIDRAGFVAGDGATHQGLFDISLLRAVPGMTLLAPASGAELRLMLEWALRQDGPCAIRYPKAACRPLGIEPPAEAEAEAPVEAGRGVFVSVDGAEPRDGTGRDGVLLAFTGSLYPQALGAARRLREGGILVGLYNLRFLKPVDEAHLTALMARYGTAVFAEEGGKSGGFGEYAAALAAKSGCTARVLALNAGDTFHAQGTRDELLSQCGLDAPGIERSVKSFLNNE
jgi:1-deoxy-D-xylulose-5-phosphate synthase